MLIPSWISPLRAIRRTSANGSRLTANDSVGSGSGSPSVSPSARKKYATSFMMQLLVAMVPSGVGSAAPVGPIGILCIQRTMAQGRIAGLATGMGAASADAIYGCIAGFGLSFISQFLVDQQMWLKLGGGLFLGYLGLRTILSKPKEKNIEAGSTDLLSDYLTTFFLTLTNPITRPPSHW